MGKKLINVVQARGVRARYRDDDGSEFQLGDVFVLFFEDVESGCGWSYEIRDMMSDGELARCCESDNFLGYEVDEGASLPPGAK